MEHPTRIGKYELEQFLGGGMSHVYRAKDSVLGRRVAVKILTEAGMADAEAKARFLLEARMASNINHENIIAVYDFGEDKGRPFIVMEFLEGESLRDAIKQGHTGDFDRRMRLALQIGRALDYIHSRKIIHRDIKPENIHIDKTGKIKLMDFGIAKSEGVQLTRAGFTLGTPYYMAPEQVLGRPLTPQADVYAFGVLMYEILTGTKPIAGESIEKIFQNILYEPMNLAPLRALGVSPAIVELVAHCTAKQLSHRAANLAYVCDEIEHCLDPTKPKPAKPAPPAAGAAAQPHEAAPPPPKPVPPASSSYPVPPGARTAPKAVVATAGMAPPQVSDGLPGFLKVLPAVFRTQAGLMLLAAVGVVALMMFFIGVLWLLKMI